MSGHLGKHCEAAGFTPPRDRALGSDRPVILEAITDPDVPTLPPHITLEQARKFTMTLLKGDPNEGGIVKQAVKGMVESLIPH